MARIRLSTLNSDPKFGWSILNNGGDAGRAKVDKLSKSGFVVKAQPFYLNRIRRSVRIGHLILRMVSIPRQDVEAISCTINPYAKFCRGVLYGA